MSTLVVVGRDRARKRMKIGGISLPEANPLSYWTDEPEDKSRLHDFETAPEMAEHPVPSARADWVCRAGKLLKQLERKGKAGDGGFATCYVCGGNAEHNAVAAPREHVARNGVPCELAALVAEYERLKS